MPSRWRQAAQPIERSWRWSGCPESSIRRRAQPASLVLPHSDAPESGQLGRRMCFAQSLNKIRPTGRTPAAWPSRPCPRAEAPPRHAVLAALPPPVVEPVCRSSPLGSTRMAEPSKLPYLPSETSDLPPCHFDHIAGRSASAAAAILAVVRARCRCYLCDRTPI